MNDAFKHRASPARGLLEIAQKRMVETYPFHARFVAMWQRQATTAVDTMGVTVHHGEISLFYNPAFVETCGFAELIGVLHHEVNHLLFEHVFLDLSKFPDQQALLVAEEVTANEWIREPLPGTPLLLAQFPHLPPNEDTFTRYQRLATGIPPARLRRPRSRKKATRDPKGPAAGPNTLCLVPKMSASDSDFDSWKPLDDHSLWQAALVAAPLGRLVVRVAIRQVAARLSPAEWQLVPLGIQHQIAHLCRDNAPGASDEALSVAHDSPLNWRHILQRYVREATEVRPVFTRAPRRFPDFIGIVPGRLYRPGSTIVMAVIDTSGSMSTTLLETIASELDRMAAVHRITVVECDAAVHRVAPYRGRLRKVRGRGGTDLRPPFDTPLLNQIRPDVLVYFTDGGGPAPAAPPPLPVIWCLTPEGQTPAAWGRTIHLPRLEY